MAQPESRHQETRRERRQQILAAAMRIFSTKGFHAANVSDVASQAGVSQGTIYWYFESKESLFEAVLQESLSAVSQPSIVLLQDDTLSPLERIQATVRQLLDELQSPPDSFRLLLNLWVQPETFASGMAQDAIQDMYQEWIEGHLGTVIRDGMERGEIATGSPEAVALVLVPDPHLSRAARRRCGNRSRHHAPLPLVRRARQSEPRG
jgi:AcrR family transcriptional regulator